MNYIIFVIWLCISAMYLGSELELNGKKKKASKHSFAGSVIAVIINGALILGVALL